MQKWPTWLRVAHTTAKSFLAVYMWLSPTTCAFVCANTRVDLLIKREQNLTDLFGGIFQDHRISLSTCSTGKQSHSNIVLYPHLKLNVMILFSNLWVSLRYFRNTKCVMPVKNSPCHIHTKKLWKCIRYTILYFIHAYLCQLC